MTNKQEQFVLAQKLGFLFVSLKLKQVQILQKDFGFHFSFEYG